MSERVPGRLHGLAISTMAISALTGIVALLAFVTVRWPGSTGRAVKFVFALATIAFLASAVAAVLAAARDIHTRDPEQ